MYNGGNEENDGDDEGFQDANGNVDNEEEPADEDEEYD